jgi:hypothetical protein
MHVHFSVAESSTTSDDKRLDVFIEVQLLFPTRSSKKQMKSKETWKFIPWLWLHSEDQISKSRPTVLCDRSDRWWGSRDMEAENLDPYGFLFYRDLSKRSKCLPIRKMQTV